MKRFKEELSKDKSAGESEALSDESLREVSGGATIPVRRKTPQPRVYTA